MNSFLCPICKNSLNETEKGYSCKLGHNYDKAKSGYVNLLMSQQSKSKRHGDDKKMVKARCDFLMSGYYNNLRDELLNEMKKIYKNGTALLDAGCGECFYTSFLYDNLVKNNASVFLGIDISKNALELAAKRGKNIKRAVASIYSIPVISESVDYLINIFAPHSETEYARILKNGGYMLRVVPCENHLFALKKAVYDIPYKNKPFPIELEGFTLINKREIKSTITLKNYNDIQNLFMMTPYYYKTAEKDFKKLLALKELTCETEFCLLVYKKSGC